LDAYEAIVTKLDIRDFAAKRVDDQTKMKVLEAARLTASSMNTQHWRFILIQASPNLKRLALDSPTGGWIEAADFAVLIMVDPRIPGNVIDAGRVLQDMQLAAWNYGIASCLYTGMNETSIRRDFGVPTELKPIAVVGFGYPRHKVLGRRKNRKTMEELVFSERFGARLSLEQS
jgi:nitroreductase